MCFVFAESPHRRIFTLGANGHPLVDELLPYDGAADRPGAVQTTQLPPFGFENTIMLDEFGIVF